MRRQESEPEDDIAEQESSDDTEAEAEAEAETETEADAVEEDGTDNVGDPSVEINVEELIHELEVQGLATHLGREGATRRRLEELMEQRKARRDLEDFEDYDI